ncbi:MULTISPECIES: ABC transporter substrate-binding protein [Dickeya]|uniref:Siderophore achromobactin ABC transporter, substrate-binding protein n=1 Tax=Dickeya aquatica TaxID=1401087 RepID=A0A375A905_9GAMM|nr:MULTISPECIES: iron-siderophore ABC transporter substrate-binding protein [Dickeya]SLM62487.1 Siderophore achromobactin ABC transporter, substrate-binding protein [Dickeya aquatica]
MNAYLLSRRNLLRTALSLLPLAAGLPALAQAPARPPRLITLFQGATDTAVALGITPVGVVDSWTEKPMYRYLRAALDGVAHVGLETQPSLEDIVLLKPEMIVASRFRHQRLQPLLSQIAPVVMLDEIYQFKTTLAVMGQALGVQVQAGQCLQHWQQRVATLQAQLRQRFGGATLPTVAVLDIREDHIRSYLPPSFPGSVLSELGFGWSETSRSQPGVSLKLTNKESLPVLDAEVFFVFLRANSPAVQRHYQSLIQHPLWQRLRAVQRGQVWVVDGVAWSLSGGILGANLMLDDIHRVTGIGGEVAS